MIFNICFLFLCKPTAAKTYLTNVTILHAAVLPLQLDGFIIVPIRF